MEPTAQTERTPQAELIHSRAYGPANKYRPEYCQQMIQYFVSAPQKVTQTVKGVLEQNELKGRTLKEEVQTICADVPTFQRFAISVGVHQGTLAAWEKKYPEFADAVQRCIEVQKDFMIQGLASGRIPGMGGIFVAKNLRIGMVDDSTVTMKQAPSTEKPTLAERSPAQLEALKAALLAAEAAGVRLTISETVAEPVTEDLK